MVSGRVLEALSLGRRGSLRDELGPLLTSEDQIPGLFVEKARDLCDVLLEADSLIL